MADIGGSQNDAFGLGVNHVVNPAKSNVNSVTLDGALQADSDRWNQLTPHGVLNAGTGAGSQDDGSWERYQRQAGGYAPGSMTEMQDQIGNGNDNLP